MDSDEWLTVEEAAARLQVNQQTIRNRMNEGKLSHYRIGRRVRMRRSDFEAFTGGPRPKPPAQTVWDGLLIEVSLPDISDPASQCPRTGVRARSRRGQPLASHHRKHSALGQQPPITRLSNLLGSYSY